MGRDGHEEEVPVPAQVPPHPQQESEGHEVEYQLVDLCGMYRAEPEIHRPGQSGGLSVTASVEEAASFCEGCSAAASPGDSALPAAPPRLWTEPGLHLLHQGLTPPPWTLTCFKSPVRVI